jgi:hypothetical protein
VVAWLKNAPSFEGTGLSRPRLTRMVADGFSAPPQHMEQMVKSLLTAATLALSLGLAMPAVAQSEKDPGRESPSRRRIRGRSPR